MKNIYLPILVLIFLFSINNNSFSQLQDSCDNNVRKDTVEKTIVGLDDRAYFNFTGEKDIDYTLTMDFDFKSLYITNDIQNVLSGSSFISRSSSFNIVTNPNTTYGTYIIKVKYKNRRDSTNSDCGIEYIRLKIIPPKVSGKIKVTEAPYLAKLPDFNTPLINTNDNKLKDIFLPRLPFVISTFKRLYKGDPDYFGDWECPDGTSIADVCPVLFNKNGAVLILLDDGSIYWTENDGRLGYTEPEMVDLVPPFTDIYDYFNYIMGDALYVTTTTMVYKADSVGKKFNIDTLGLNQATIQMVKIDTNQTVYLATSNGLMRQGLNETIWSKIPALPATYLTALFIDKSNRIFVSSSYNVYVSTDDGSTWLLDTLGLDHSGVSKFTEDKYGNVYGIDVVGLNVFTRLANQQNWQNYNTTSFINSADPDANRLVHDISADSLLMAATAFGLFQSSDFGKTWNENKNKNFECNIFYNFLEDVNSGKYYLTTNRGLFIGDPKKNNWTKLFPQSGNQNQCPIFIDKNGTLYTQGNFSDNEVFHLTPRTMFKSTNQGGSWQADTTGMSNTTRYDGRYFVDLNGNQYLASTIILDTTQKGNVFIKKPGNSWQKNESGIALKYQDQTLSFGTDNFANVYLAVQSGVTGRLMKLPFGGDTWTDDSKGLDNSQVYVYAGNPKNQKVYVGTYNNGIYMKTSDTWSKIPNPSQVQGGSSCFALSVDPDGTLFACYGTFDQSFNFKPTGTYFTNDDGKTWLSADLDKINATFLASYPDSTYAVTDRGLYAINKNQKPSPVYDSKGNVTQLNLEQNYPNPFSISTTIKFEMPYDSPVSVKVFDILGNEIGLLMNEYLTTGTYSVEYKPQFLQNGVYFIKLTTNQESVVKMMLKTE
ncbi:MAG: T9SS type A sorting domain-containing protein [FCB group bacterium]